MTKPKDITETLPVERLELFEERLDVYLEALTVLYHTEPYDGHDFDYLIVMGEMYAKNEPTLKQNVTLIVTAYNSAGRVIGLEECKFWKHRFFGLEAFQVKMKLHEMPIKIRIYPR